MPFIFCLEHSAGKDGYWKYEHMIAQSEDFIDVLTYLYPQFVFHFELNHSNGHNWKQLSGLLTSGGELNLKWNVTQQKAATSIQSPCFETQHQSAGKSDKIAE